MKGKNVQINDYKKLTKIERQILDVILENPQITQVNIAKILKRTPKTVQRGIATLKREGIIERVGSNKKGYWKIVKQNKYIEIPDVSGIFAWATGVFQIKQEKSLMLLEYISLIDQARQVNLEETKIQVKAWMKNKNVIS